MSQLGTLQQVKLADLSAHPRNYRKHGEDQIQRIAESLQRYGQRRVIVVQAGSNRVVAGHGVVEAARHLGWENLLADVWECDDTQAAAYLIDDNELQRLADDDREELASLLADLHEDLPPLSYRDDEIEDLLRELTMPRMGEGDAVGMSAEELAAEWMGLPEVDGADDPACNCIVWFRNQTDRDQFMKNNELRNHSPSANVDKTMSAWWPPKPIDHLTDEMWESGG